ncbi:transcriptional regulator [Halomicrococcus sp. NG-SE-24]|uniref:transcriptional regulator n=1 Tax=Halomicrococcus sp. NG-SE-24 TaxID=3436928 RepID=UPI003D95CC3D
MPKERDEESGQYTESVSDDEILAFLDNQNGAGTVDVADAFDYKQPTAYRRLKRLEDEDRVTGRKIGGSLLWETIDT